METVVVGFGLVLVLALVFALPILGIRDALRYPDAAWAATEMQKRTWVGAMACGPVFFIPIVSLVGIAASGVYWSGRRKRLRQAAAAVSRSGAVVPGRTEASS